MKTEEFIAKFAEEFEMTDVNEITSKTEFKNLDEWDSLISLSIIGMINNTYKVKISGKDINSVNTVEELFNLVKSKI